MPPPPTPSRGRDGEGGLPFSDNLTNLTSLTNGFEREVDYFEKRCIFVGEKFIDPFLKYIAQE